MVTGATAADLPADRPVDVEVEVLTACPLCGGERLAPWRQGVDRVHRRSRRRFTYSRCRDCALLFLSTRPLETEIGRFYPGDYGPYHAEVEPGVARGKPRPRSFAATALRRGFRKLNAAAGWLAPADRSVPRLEELYEPPFAGAALLDFGCGSTRFLDRARAAGWRTIGLDVSPDVVARVSAGGHQAHLASPDVWRQIPDASLDLARLHHTLEHLYRPRDALVEIHRKMQPGARLHLGLPNPEGISSRLFGSRWWGLECPRHVMLFSPDRIRRLLRDLDFRDVELVHEAVTKDSARSWGYLLHDLGRVERDAVLRMAGGALAEGLRLPMRLLARFGLADRFHVLARKGGPVGG